MPVNEAFVDDEGILNNPSPDQDPPTNMENNGPTTATTADADAEAAASNPAPPPATENDVAVTEDKSNKSSKQEQKLNVKSMIKMGLGVSFWDKSWTRKLFLTAADLAYPGIVDLYGREGRERALKQKRQVVACEVKTSLPVQMLLNAELRFLVVWIGYYLWNIRKTLASLKHVHGQIYCIVFGMFIFTNFIRIVAGMAGNRTDNTPKLAAYWFTTILIQPPQLLFLMLTNMLIARPCYQLIAVDLMLMVFIIGEIIIVFFHVKTLLRGEVDLLRKETEGIANKNK